jgi:ABC-type transport system involved in multi-copper enzyme maturation permease subunit
MSLMQGIYAVLRFEMRRTLTIARITVWLLLTVVPILIVLLAVLLSRNSGQNTHTAMSTMMYALVPEVNCILGLLLWMTPAVHSELETKTWVYLAVRPEGRRTVLLGKYLTAIVWSLLSAMIILLVTVPLLTAYDAVDRPVHLFMVLLALSLLSCIGRGAAYAVFAVALPQRAMAFAVAYTVIFDYIVGFIPAVINQLAVQFHLRCLFVRWMNFEELEGTSFTLFFDDAPAWQHLMALSVFVVLVLPAAIFVLERRQFPSADEG